MGREGAEQISPLPGYWIDVGTCRVQLKLALILQALKLAIHPTSTLKEQHIRIG